MFFMLHKCELFFTHTHIRDCVHILKFVVEEIGETAVCKTVVKSRRVFETGIIPVYSTIAEDSINTWNVPTTQLCNIWLLVPLELKWNTQENSCGASTIHHWWMQSLAFNPIHLGWSSQHLGSSFKALRSRRDHGDAVMVLCKGSNSWFTRLLLWAIPISKSFRVMKELWGDF